VFRDWRRNRVLRTFRPPGVSGRVAGALVAPMWDSRVVHSPSPAAMFCRSLRSGREESAHWSVCRRLFGRSRMDCNRGRRWSVQAAASTWLVSVGPTIGILASRRDFLKLRRLVDATVRRGVLACLLFAVASFSLVMLLHRYAFEYSKRFGDDLTIAVFLAVGVAMQVSNVETAAIRFQKKEPFVVVSVVC